MALLKSITYTVSLVLCLYLGYFFGAQHSVLQQDSNMQAQSCDDNTQQPLPLTLPDPQQCQCDASVCSDIANNHNAQGLTTLFTQLLNQANYTEAVSFYHTILRLSPDSAPTLKARLLRHIKGLMEQPPYHSAQADDAINTYLADFYDDVDMLLLQATSYFHQGLFHESLNTFQLAYSYTYDDTNKQRITDVYTAFDQQLRQFYANKQQYEALISLYLYAENVGLLTNAQRFYLVELYIYTQNDYDAKLVAQKLQESPNWQEKTLALLEQHNLLDKPEEKPDNTGFDSSIPLVKINDQFIVSVDLSNTETSLLIDTGASMTTISQTYYESIKRSTVLSHVKSQTFLTANGKTTGSVYRADKLRIGEYTLNDIEVAVLDYPTGKDASGLLGMNVLRHFKFTIDQQQSTLELTPIQ